MEITTPVSGVKGVGAKTEQLFQKTGVYTIGDILLRFPREYTRFPEPVEISGASAGKKQAVIVRVESPVIVKRTKAMQIAILNGTHLDKKMECLWFRMPYVRNTLTRGQTFILYGNVQEKGGLLSMEQPVIYTPVQYEAVAGSLQPVYGLTSGLTNNLYKKTLRQVLDAGLLLPDYLPAQTKKTYGLAEYNYAVSQIHFPKDFDALADARRRLVFDEFFLFLLYMQLQKEQGQTLENIYQFREEDLLTPLLEKLPYKLTGAQLRVLDEIVRDLHGPHIMQRLIQGDVGSGKTIVAFLAMYLASASGYQSALMAPTEVLAAQHYETFEQYVELFGIKTHLVLLTGAMTAKQKRRAYERMQLFDDAMIIGTHALFQEKAVYDHLALVITDEQHRFGVRQRETFSLKGESPHILVMSATPIPRTLAIILYGDLDISVIDEVPARRHSGRLFTWKNAFRYEKQSNGSICGKRNTGACLYDRCGSRRQCTECDGHDDRRRAAVWTGAAASAARACGTLRHAVLLYYDQYVRCKRLRQKTGRTEPDQRRISDRERRFKAAWPGRFFRYPTKRRYGVSAG